MNWPMTSDEMKTAVKVAAATGALCGLIAGQAPFDPSPADPQNAFAPSDRIVRSETVPPVLEIVTLEQIAELPWGRDPRGVDELAESDEVLLVPEFPGRSQSDEMGAVRFPVQSLPVRYRIDPIQIERIPK